MNIENLLIKSIKDAISSLYANEITDNLIQLQETRKEFTGDITVVTFPFLKFSKKSPEQTGLDIGNFLKTHLSEVDDFNVIKGFLNIIISRSYWLSFLQNITKNKNYGVTSTGALSRTVMVEYSSPNTNKPLHLGHVRNNLLGVAISNILKAAGHKVIMVNLVNDRGIHICKSMLAWKKWGEGDTPQKNRTGKHIKGDHFIGQYYVMFNSKFKEQIDNLLKKFVTEKPNSEEIIRDEEYFFHQKERITGVLIRNDVYTEPYTAFKTILSNIDSIEIKPIIKNYLKDHIQRIIIEELPQTLLSEAQEMLRKWEAKDKKVFDLWQTMNGWVYEGFDETYNKLGVKFDHTYYESQTYLLGKSIVQKGLDDGILYKKPDNSVWSDLTGDGLDEKLLLRSDGTSVYITQDLGTACQRFDQYHMDEMIYVVGNEQNYHFQVLSLILQKLGYSWASQLKHMSYGMVELPSGKMKSREGTVVDADDLIREMTDTALKMSFELGKLEGLSENEKDNIVRVIGLGALKYFILKVDPKKNMLFDPQESIDFNGNTGPFIQYTYTRIQSVLRKGADMGLNVPAHIDPQSPIDEKEKQIIKLIFKYPSIVCDAGETLSPALIANYVYEIAKEFNQFYHDYPILKEENPLLREFRLALSKVTGEIIRSAMALLGIEVPERM
jgi:arginyl-tRNA synthetase